MAGFLNRQNNVPHYQKLHQTHDGLRTWQKARGRWMVPPFQYLLFGTFGCSMYMMVRMLLGHKTWFSKN
ncbi:hypothetical protein GQ43DRAFT_480940 [Delitschia confertaspora ATCC 74209]|uniref:Uncharacterized protein n=1 Tax=Delitschia confertaspora ATCC 74209 TaxID=1513339 RepID=A0A9P4MYR9_9PLEO|nr:hypothetical protein GQ43DRAFT_480940 [Delitschia confertaspora ATCC 74209]